MAIIIGILYIIVTVIGFKIGKVSKAGKHIMFGIAAVAGAYMLRYVDLTLSSAGFALIGIIIGIMICYVIMCLYEVLEH